MPSGLVVINFNVFKNVLSHRFPIHDWLRFNELLKRTQIWQSELNDKLSQEQQQGEVLKELAQRDRLTGLANRLHFEQLIQHMVQHSVQHNSLSALVFIDLDNFKFVNDNFGHDAGDAVLVEISRRLASVISTV